MATETTIKSIQNVKEEFITNYYLTKATEADKKWMNERAAYWDEACKGDGKLNKRKSYAHFRKDFVDRFMPELTVKKQTPKKSNSLVEVLKAADARAAK